MRKFLIIILTVGIIIIGLVNLTFAAPNFVTVNSENNAGLDYLDGFSLLFEAGTYEFSVSDGAWNDLIGFSNHWMWNINIYQESNATEYLLGDSTTYATAVEAFNAHSSDPPLSITLSSDENLWFYIKDNDSITANNLGSVTVGVNSASGPAPPPIIPEPVSSILFIAGGMVLAGRRYYKKRKSLEFS